MRLLKPPFKLIFPSWINSYIFGANLMTWQDCQKNRLRFHLLSDSVCLHLKTWRKEKEKLMGVRSFICDAQSLVMNWGVTLWHEDQSYQDLCCFVLLVQYTVHKWSWVNLNQQNGPVSLYVPMEKPFFVPEEHHLDCWCSHQLPDMWIYGSKNTCIIQAVQCFPTQKLSQATTWACNPADFRGQILLPLLSAIIKSFFHL